MANNDGWWGEGNDKFYVDGAVKPTIEGTGSEDYFLRRLGISSTPSPIPTTAWWSTPMGKRAARKGAFQHVLSLAHRRPRPVHQVAKIDDRAWPQRPG